MLQLELEQKVTNSGLMMEYNMPPLIIAVSISVCFVMGFVSIVLIVLTRKKLKREVLEIKENIGSITQNVQFMDNDKEPKRYRIRV